MNLLIDGYNLLHATGIVGQGMGAGTLERSREALLNFLAMSLSSEEAAQTTVVFDAKEAPPGLPRVVQHRGLTVRFAAKEGEADDVLESMIRANSSPRRLTVVSSDHRVQRAARRRRARAVDSEIWYQQLCRSRRDQPGMGGEAASAKPRGPLSPAEVRDWLREFGALDSPSADSASSEHPFPSGYARDVLREEDDGELGSSGV